MRRVIGAINMTLDGICDHRVGIVDEELLEHYTNLLETAEVILYGRITYQLMQFWQTYTTSSQKSMDNFATSINKVQKLVFSNTLKDTGWNTAKLATKSLLDEVLELKKQPGKDIYIGSRSLIIQLLNSRLMDEFQICIHPIVEGKTGLLLFEQIKDRITFNLIRTKTLPSGVIILYYQPN